MACAEGNQHADAAAAMSSWWSHYSPIFTPKEFVCKCRYCPGSTPQGVAEIMDKAFVGRLYLLRMRLGSGITITSGYRCPAHNATVSSTGRSGPHTTGHAADLDLNRERGFHILKWLEELGFTGIGFQQKGNGRFIHLDDLSAPAHPRPTIWSY